MIKGKSAYPFHTIALAVAFSPGLLLLVAEIRRLCLLHNSRAVFIHVGKKTGDKQRELSGLLTANEFSDSNSRVYWEQGDIASSVLRICKNEIVDLLIAGISNMDKFKLPAGKTAIEIVMNAKCSVLLYSEHYTGSFKRIAVNGVSNRKLKSTVETALYFAEKEHSEHLIIVDLSGENIKSRNLLPQTRQLSRISDMAGEGKGNTVSMEFVNIGEYNYSTICEYGFKSNMDLIVTPSPDRKENELEEVIQLNDLKTILRDLPCNLLVVHTRLTEK